MAPSINAARILICCHDFSRGGTERIAIGLAHQWAARGRQVSFLCGTTSGGLRETLDAGIGVEELTPPIHRSLFSRARLARAMAARIAEIAPDIVFLPGNFHLVLAPAIHAAIAQAGIPTRIALKLSNPLAPHGIAAPLLKAIIRRYGHCIDGVAAMNTGLAREATALLPGIHVRTLFDPIYLHHKAPAAHSPARDGQLHVLWAGRFEPQKDVMLALRTIQALSQHTPCRLTLLGTGSQQRAVEKAIQRMGLADIVTAPGHVPRIDPWLAGGDALLVTSHYEGGPAVAVEALAHGVPVVATDCSHFLHDIMTVPQAGQIVPSRDPQRLAAALADLRGAPPPAPEQLAALVTRLEPDSCANAYLAWFDSLMEHA